MLFYKKNLEEHYGALIGEWYSSQIGWYIKLQHRLFDEGKDIELPFGRWHGGQQFIICESKGIVESEEKSRQKSKLLKALQETSKPRWKLKVRLFCMSHVHVLCVLRFSFFFFFFSSAPLALFMRLPWTVQIGQWTVILKVNSNWKMIF